MWDHATHAFRDLYPWSTAYYPIQAVKLADWRIDHDFAGISKGPEK
jgi:hypothetical protein